MTCCDLVCDLRERETVSESKCFLKLNVLRQTYPCQQGVLLRLLMLLLWHISFFQNCSRGKQDGRHMYGFAMQTSSLRQRNFFVIAVSSTSVMHTYRYSLTSPMSKRYQRFCGAQACLRFFMLALVQVLCMSKDFCCYDHGLLCLNQRELVLSIGTWSVLVDWDCVAEL